MLLDKRLNFICNGLKFCFILTGVEKCAGIIGEINGSLKPGQKLGQNRYHVLDTLAQQAKVLGGGKFKG